MRWLSCPDVLTDDQLAGQVRLPPQLPLTQGVETAFLDRARRLPDDAQTLLLVAAADDSGQAATVAAAAELLGAGPSAWDTAERSGLVRERDGDLLLRHPLVRSAVYAAATTSQRRAAHQALASALMAVGDVDRRTWHLALAASGPDERLAEELDAVAERANRRAGHEAASAASERAAALTASPDLRARRLFTAATSSWQAGDGPRARALADDGRAQASDPILAADLDRLRGRLEWNVGSPQTGHAIVMAAARGVAATDPKRALELAMLGTTLATFGANPDGSGRTDETPYLPTLSASAPAELRCLAAVIAGQQHILRGEYRDAAEELRQAFRLAESLPPTVDIWANLGIGAFHLGDDELTTRTFSQLLLLGRTAGAMSIIITALTRLPCGQLPAGQWRSAAASADEALAVARGMSSPALSALPLGWLAVLSAFRGEATAPSVLAEVEQVRQQHVLGIVALPVDDVVEWVKGILAANARDDSRAIHHLERISHPDLARLAAVDRIEAAVRALRLDLAGLWVTELDSFGAAVGARWASAAAEHGRAPARGRRDRGPAFRTSSRAARGRRASGRPGKDRAGVRRVPAPYRPARRRPRPPAPRPGGLRRRRRGPLGRAGRSGAARLGRSRAQTGRDHHRTADPAGAADRPAGRPGPDQPGGRGAAVPQPADGRVPPEQRLPEARRPLPQRAGPADPRLANPWSTGATPGGTGERGGYRSPTTTRLEPTMSHTAPHPTGPATAPTAPEQEERRSWAVLAIALTAQLLVVLDISVVNTALPTIGTALSLRGGDLQWLVTAYLLMSGGGLLLGGRVADLLPRRRVFLSGLSVFTTASLLSGLATGAGTLIAARGAQGLGAALMTPAALSLIMTTYAGGQRAKGLALWGALGSVAVAAGVLFGGALTTWVGWQMIFWVNVPIGIAAFVAGRIVIPKDPARSAGLRELDLPGAVAAVGGLAALLLGIQGAGDHGWTSIRTVASAGPGRHPAGLLHPDRASGHPAARPAAHLGRQDARVRYHRHVRRHRHPGRRRSSSPRSSSRPCWATRPCRPGSPSCRSPS